MSNIKLWLLSVCVFSVIMSLFRILLPRGNVKKDRRYRVVFNIFAVYNKLGS